MDKKGQEEIIGFVLIVGMIMIAGFMFLFFSTSSKGEERNDLEIENLVNAWVFTNLNSRVIVDLVKDCENGACQELEESVFIIKDALKAKGTINSINGWSLNITSENHQLFYSSEGKLTGDSKAAFVPISRSNVKLKIWYAYGNSSFN